MDCILHQWFCVEKIKDNKILSKHLYIYDFESFALQHAQ